LLMVFGGGSLLKREVNKWSDREKKKRRKKKSRLAEKGGAGRKTF